MKDMFMPKYGRIEVFKLFADGTKERIYCGHNAITYRGKVVMSRLLGGGLLPNTAPAFEFGDGPDTLKITGFALGNGGHLIYETSSKSTASLPKVAGSIVNRTLVTADQNRPAMPFISGSDWGYASLKDRVVPGTSYEDVENGNVPWDGVPGGAIVDNSVGISENQANVTLYSETYRIPLDSADGVSYPTDSEVQFKATLPQGELNATRPWGFSAQPANLISEIGLVQGTITQVYSLDGNEPGAGAGQDYGDGSGASNFPSGQVEKDTNLTGGDSYPTTIVNGVDTWPGDGNAWNLITRKTMPAVPKSSAFSLVFLYTLGF